MRRQRGVRPIIARVARQAWVYHALDVRGRSQCACNGECIRPVCFHPEMKGFGTTLGKPRVVRAWYSANGVLQEPEVGVEFGVVRREDDGAHDHVRVTIDVFCYTMHDNVGAEEERGGVKRRQESVVYQNEGIGRV